MANRTGEQYKFGLPEKLQDIKKQQPVEERLSTSSSISDIMAIEWGLIKNERVKGQVVDLLSKVGKTESQPGTMVVYFLTKHLGQTFYHMENDNFTLTEVVDVCREAYETILSDSKK